ncbi:MAG TPA: HAD family phosphatase [Solirubrobacter sp.]|nr:HAD family phosphatase [Solirubrobacter sp.]
MTSIGVVFDCDGTLVDSEPLAGEAWRRILARHSYELTTADLSACVGRSYAHTHAYLAGRAPLPDADAVWELYSRELFGLIDTRLRPFEDALEAVRELRERGVAVAVASSSVRERLDRTLARAGLAFEITLAGDEVEHGKPAPDMYLEAARRLGVERCVAVEDSAPGVASALAAGMPVLGVRRDGLGDLSAATRVVETVTADAILGLLDDTRRAH